ncbi:unnamed protein product, partial [Prorocentrum cordatum]
PGEAFRTLQTLLPPLTDCSPEAIGALPLLQFALGDSAVFDVRPEHYVGVATTGPDGCRYNLQGVGDTSTRTVVLGVPFLLDRDVAFDQGRMRVGATGGRPEPHGAGAAAPPSASDQAAGGASSAGAQGPRGVRAGRRSPVALALRGGRLRRANGHRRARAAAA